MACKDHFEPIENLRKEIWKRRAEMQRALELLKIGLEKGQATREWARGDLDFENLRKDVRLREIVGESIS